MHLKTIFFAGFLLPSIIVLSFHTDPVSKMAGLLMKWSTDHPVEKVHLHMDKSLYAIGDTIWFKAYVTTANNNLSKLSGVLNVELVDEKDSLCSLIKLPIVSGTSWGDFVLADSLAAGNYRIRAYTNWMRNAGGEYFFDRIVPVGDGRPFILKTNRGGKNITKTINEPDLQFFPEGGDLVNGILSTVAFKAVDTYGKGIEVKGIVVDDKDKMVVGMKTQHLGMGSFTMLPEKGKSYRAKVVYPNGTEKLVSLPIAKDRGSVLTINNKDAKEISINISLNPDFFAEVENTEFNLVGQSGGRVLYDEKFKITDKKFTVHVIKTKFPSGIVQFTLFSNSGDPLNERLVFIQNSDQLNLSIGTEKASFKQGDPVMIYLTARNSNNQFVKGTFSVSVVNEEIVPYEDINEHTIFSDLLLTSDLKGYVEKPNYYFINISDDTRSDLDKLMLTQGYRRFEWNQLISGNIPLSNYKVEKGIAISGRLKSLFGKPIQNGTVSLIGPKGGLFKHTQTDGKGKFAFEDLTFSDTSEVMIQAQTQKGNRNVVINLEKTNTQFRSGKYHQYQSDIDTKLMPAYAENSRKQYGVQRKDAIQLQAVKITAIKIVQPHTSNMGGLGNYDEIITSDILTKGAGTLSQRLTRSGKLNGIIFQNGKPFNLRGRSLHKSDMTLVLDGVYIPDTLGMTIDDINPNDVSSVEILRNAGTMGVYGVKAGHGGIIVINSKKGNENNNNSKKYVAGLVVSNMRGFYPAKIFYIPKYKTFQENSRIQDFRSTMLWQPNLVTDLYGRAMSKTFNSSIIGTYRVVAEGMDMEGNIGREVYRYSIKD